MSLVGERIVPDHPPREAAAPPPLAPIPTPPTSYSPELQREIITRAAWRAGVLGALNVATRVLAIRFTLMISVIGAGLLTWFAIAEHDPVRLIAVAIYTCTVCLPLVWLAGK